jgi:hypothetical protein
VSNRKRQLAADRKANNKRRRERLPGIRKAQRYSISLPPAVLHSLAALRGAALGIEPRQQPEAA